MDTRLLIVDDDTSILEGFKEALGDKGYWVEGASSGREALSMIKERYYHIVLMDIVLKKANGVELIREIIKTSGDTIVIMITAYPSADSAIASFRAGAFDYLVKPIGMEALEEVLKKGEGRRKEENRLRTLKRSQEMAQEESFEKNYLLKQMSRGVQETLIKNSALMRNLSKSAVIRKQMDLIRGLRSNNCDLDNLAQNVRDVINIEQGQIELENKDFVLEDLVQSVAKDIYPVIEEKPVEFVYEMDKDVPQYLKGDPQRVRQVLMSLIRHAADFTQEGTVRLKARLMTIIGEGCHIFFIVQDSSPSIAKDQQLKLFKPFSSAGVFDQGRWKRRSLDLWMCKILVEKMGGLISMHSNEMSGNEFRFSIRFNCTQSIF